MTLVFRKMWYVQVGQSPKHEPYSQLKLRISLDMEVFKFKKSELWSKSDVLFLLE